MILVALAALCAVSVPLTGGKLRRLTDLELRWLWMTPVPLLVQLVIVTIAPGGDRPWHAAMHVATYAVALAFLWANRRIVGVRTITAGTVANAAAILANGGVMPAAATALRLAGIHPDDGFANSAHLVHAHLPWLGDVIPVPGPWPLGNVLSAGDLVIYLGLLVLLHRTCGAPSRQGAKAGASGRARPHGWLRRQLRTATRPGPASGSG